MWLRASLEARVTSMQARHRPCASFEARPLKRGRAPQDEGWETCKGRVYVPRSPKLCARCRSLRRFHRTRDATGERWEHGTSIAPLSPRVWRLGFRPRYDGAAGPRAAARDKPRVHGGTKARETSVAGIGSAGLADPRHASTLVSEDRAHETSASPVCSPPPSCLATGISAAEAAAKKEFNIAWSIYVGWMPWPYAADAGIVKKWADKYGITINVTQINDYVESINQYTAGKFDGVTVTNMDALTIPAAGGVDTSAIIMGDFSNGNDGVVLKDGKTLADIKGRDDQHRRALGLPLSACPRPRLGRPEREGRQDGQHLRRRHRRRLQGAGVDGGGHLESAADGGEGRARTPPRCSIRARSPARSRT